MKYIRKIISFVLVFASLFSLTVPALAAPTDSDLWSVKAPYVYGGVSHGTCLYYYHETLWENIWELVLSGMIIAGGHDLGVDSATLGGAGFEVVNHFMRYLTSERHVEQLIKTYGTAASDGGYGFVFNSYYYSEANNAYYATQNAINVGWDNLSAICLCLNACGFECRVVKRNLYIPLDGDYDLMPAYVISAWNDTGVYSACFETLSSGAAVSDIFVTNKFLNTLYCSASDSGTSNNSNYNSYTGQGSSSTTTDSEGNKITNITVDSGDTLETILNDYNVDNSTNYHNSTIITLEDGSQLVYDYRSGDFVSIDNLEYSPVDNTYKVYIDDREFYINYTTNYNYYTYVTIIGETAEYDIYQVYYELPDGRSSADLTAEEIEQISLNFDVINYGVSADDGRLRALYHFDGDLEDSSYWSKYSKWDWVSGASITYLEANAFGGALYFDEKAHEFTITLPSNFASSDFSILFRYYVSPTTSTSSVQDLVLKSGDVALWTVNVSSTNIVPAGQWFELALIRDGSRLYCYINGIVVGSSSFTSVLGNTLTFSFAKGSVYRQLDELRVYNFALYEGGIDYTPVVSPVDTNAVLILPDNATPVPDAYWNFNTEGNLLTYQDFTNGEAVSSLFSEVSFYQNTTGSITPVSSSFQFTSFGSYFGHPNSSTASHVVYSDYLHLSRYNSSFNVSSFTGYFDGTVGNSVNQYPTVVLSDTGGYTSYFNVNSSPMYLMCCAGYNYASSSYFNPYGFSSGDSVSFSLVTLDGNTYSSSLKLGTMGSTISSFVPSVNVVEVDGLGYIGCIYCAGGVGWQSVYRPFFFVFMVPTTSAGMDIVYMELKKGEPNDQSGAYVTEIYSDLDLNSPTIAVRSQIPVREYRIGGVRPTVPYRGDVWFMVEDSHITSVQIYTGFAWTEVDCRIWTGQRWVSPLYYNIRTLQDHLDVSGTTDNEYIQSTEGFYSWLTLQFKELLDILNEISDQLEDIDSGGGTSLDFTFEIDGGITVEFTKLSDDARDGLLTVVQPIYEVVFSELGTIFDGVLSDFTQLFSTTENTITIDGETGYTFWYIFNADKEVWNVRAVC